MSEMVLYQVKFPYPTVASKTDKGRETAIEMLIDFVSRAIRENVEEIHYPPDRGPQPE